MTKCAALTETYSQKSSELKESLINELNGQIAELRTENNTLHHRVLILEAELAEAAGKPLSTREKATLLEIILGMAVDSYGFNASNPYQKSSTPKAIADAMVRVGIHNPPTPETIRGKLRLAAGVPEEGD